MKKTLLAITLIGLLALPLTIIAATPENPTEFTWDQIKSFLRGALYTIGGLVVVVMLLVAGLLFATAGGDAEKLTSAKNTLIWAIAGAIVLIVAASVWTIISGWGGAGGAVF